LVRRLSDEKEKYFLSDEDIETLKKYCDLEKLLDILGREKVIDKETKISKVPFYRPKEKGKGLKAGYKGRIGIYEVLELTDDIKKLVHQRATAEDIQKLAIAQGMETMVEDGFVKAAQGVTSLEEVFRVISE